MQYRIKNALIALLLLAQLVACKKDDIAPPVDRTTIPRTIGQFIQNNYDLSLLHAALVKTGLVDSLEQPSYGTFFAPDNKAFNTMGILTKADIERLNTDSLREALRGHLITQRLFVSQFPVQMGSQYITKSGRMMYVSVSKGSANAEDRYLAVNGAVVLFNTKRNIGLANGVVHMVTKLMQYHDGSVQDFLAADTSLTLFVTAMKRFNYWEGLKVNNPLTVYAPNNEAFAKKGITADSINRMDPAAFREDLFGIYHFNMTPKRIFSTDGWLIYGSVYGDQGIKYSKYSVGPQYNYSLWNNEESSGVNVALKNGIYWSPNADGITETYYEGHTTAHADHLTGNGIVHVVEDLFLYPENLRK